jgi:hypothetical protein
LLNAQTHDWKIRRKPGKYNPANFTQRRKGAIEENPEAAADYLRFFLAEI